MQLEAAKAWSVWEARTSFLYQDPAHVDASAADLFALAFARGVARTAHVMHAGRVVESGPPAEVFGQPRHEATRAFLTEHRPG